MRKWVQATIAFLAFTLFVFSVYAAVPILKTIHGTAVVKYVGDVAITGFTFLNDTAVEVDLYASKTINVECTIVVSGAGISGTQTVTAGWSGPVTKVVTISGTLMAGTIVIEVTS